MQLRLPEEARYGAIKLKELSREQCDDGCETVHYEVSAMKESDYKRFIAEYKENYGKSDFDLQKHFQAREAATLKRTITYCFKY